MKVSNHILATRMARRYNQQGLTLIELLVVLVILIALAGILIPQLPSMLVRTHAAAGSTNLSEVNKRIQEFEQLYFQQPSLLDNLVASGGATLVDYLPNEGGAAGGELVPLALDADQAASLIGAGINTFSALLETAPANATFDPYDGVATIAPAATVSVASVTQAAVQRTLRPGSVAGDVFVAFGVGQRSEMIGRTISEAPYHFGEGSGDTPDAVYSRFLAVYKVEDAAGALERAEFVGVLSIHPDRLGNATDHVNEFFENDL
ncbi:prepilin-type N-terminal cleavage/methylation domain-containing protein [Prosthecobacter sp.]|uniref:type II secretion system protein n=1 Tax=Prosthecobacter sp. TaxID=1965333 RepID=UPI0024872332|nr:prepilin-type N-terminal cleavage/methylation domain-containing protein [Prosthecobacter sp.]MDI1312477.1 prepilin-type N-terminal cleavage/methylation domain-containing protein [Prosthecobacter sp.]